MVKHNQRAEVCLTTAFHSFPQELGTSLAPRWGRGGEHLQVSLQGNPPRPGSCPKVGHSLSHHLCWKSSLWWPSREGSSLLGSLGRRIPPGWAPLRPLTDGKQNPNCYTRKSFTQAHGAAPLFPFQRIIIFGNNYECLLRHGWVSWAELCAHRLCFSGMSHLPQLSTALKEFCIRFFDAVFCQTSYRSALHHSSSPDAELHILGEGNFADVWEGV